MYGKVPTLFLPVLRVLSTLQKVGMWLRKKKKKVKFRLRVISFGGITLGGVGKTPAVLKRAESEILSGKKVCIVSRGYKGKNFSGTVIGKRAGANILLEFYLNGAKIEDKSVSFSECCRVMGDELTLALYKFPDVVVFKDKDRVRALKLIEKFGFDVAILDDGFQYVMVDRDEDIVLINALDPWGNGEIFPAGVLREPLTSLARATEIWIANANLVGKEELKRIITNLQVYTGCDKPIKMVYYEPLEWIKWSTGDKISLDSFRNVVVDVYCALGNPTSFLRTVEALGIKIRNKFIYRDHYLFPKEIIIGDVPILTTEKNVLSLESDFPEVYALSVRLAEYNLDS